MITKYEAVMILNADLDESAIKEEVSKVGAAVKAHQGTVELTDLWGKRQLSYKINKKDYGFYVYLVFGGDSSLVAELHRQLRINDNVMRYLIVKKDKFAPDPMIRKSKDTGKPGSDARSDERKAKIENNKSSDELAAGDVA